MKSLRGKEAKDILSAIQQQGPTYIRKTIYNPYKKKFQQRTTSNKKITHSRLPFYPSVHSTWVGDDMHKNINNNNIRFWCQNCNGIKISDAPNLQHNFTQIHEHNINYFSFTETNLNVANPNAQAKIRKQFGERFKGGRLSNTNTDGYPKSSYYQPGGISSGFNIHLQTRYMTHEKDKLGRWHSHTFRGKDRDIKVYTVYRVHRKSDDTAGVTTAWSQQRTILRSKGIQKNPRDDVIDSLCINLRKDIESNRAIILMGDFNECINSREKTHERLLEIGLVNMMQERIGDDLPKTWNRGKSAIDHVYMTSDVFKSVRKAGYAPFDTIALSDHRGIFFDLDTRVLFDDEIYKVEPAAFRRLKSTHPKHTKEYAKLMKEQWKTHKIDERLLKLSKMFDTEGPTNANVIALNTIDKQITEIMKHSEKKCSKISRHATDPWSPKLKSIAREIRYTIVQIKHALRDVKSPSMVKCFSIVNSLQDTLKEKKLEYREYLKNARLHREKHLDERAQHHAEINPKSSKPSEIKRLKNIEVQIRDSTKIRFTLDDFNKESATYILIPSRKEYNNFDGFDGNILSVTNIWRRILIQNGNDIDDWVRVTDKKLIEDMLLQWQVHHFMQSVGTPFTTDFWTEELANKEVSDLIIAGKYEPPEDLPWEADAILKSMKRSPKIKKEIDPLTTLDQFKSFYKNAKESTSSSPSGRHYGHYKALLQMDATYIECIHSILHICTVHDLILDRWKPTLCSLIEKISGKPFINKYRTIHIIESDIQFLSKQIYVLGMMRQAEKYKLINDQQYGGRNRRQCQSASLNKIAYYDLSRQTIMPCAFLDADAKACYHRIVHRLSEVEVRKWGVSHKSAAFTTKFLHKQQFHLRTTHGISKKYYSYNPNRPIQGSGQGIGWAGPRWTASSDAISDIMAERCTGMLYSDPAGEIEVRRNGDIFVDDLDIGVTQSAIKVPNKTPIECLQEDEQMHALLLSSEGHGLNPLKCSFYYVGYKRDDLTHVQLTNAELPGEINVRVSYDSEPEPIKRLEPSSPHKTLGINPTVSGNRSPQLDILRKKIKKWARNVKSSSLSSRERLVAYFGYILRSIQFVVSTTSFNKIECKELDKIISPVLLHAVRVHRNASRVPLYTPKSMGGYGFVNIFHVQGIEKLKFFFMHYRLNDTTGQLIKISIRYSQLEMGTSTPFYLLDHKQHQFLVTETWTTQIWDYMCACKYRFVEVDPWKYVKPRENDFFLMDVITKSSLPQRYKMMFNQIRMYMKLLTVSDIIDPDTNAIYPHVLRCEQKIKSTLGWPNIHKFPRSWISVWKSILNSIIIPKVQHLPLGKWTSKTHQETSTQSVDSTEAETTEVENTEVKITEVEITKNASTSQKKIKLTIDEIYFDSKILANVCDNINKRIKEAEKWKLHSWGIKSVPRKTLHVILFEYMRNNLIVVSDASVKYGRAGHAFCFANKKTGKVLLSGGSKVHGNFEFTTSYRAEMFSIIAAITLLDLILQTAGITKAKVHFYTDSEASITATKNHKLHTLHYVLTNDMDVANQLYHEWKTVPQQFTLNHVHGHQDKHKKISELPVPSQLNVLMDTKSKEIVELTYNASNKILPLPAQQIYVCQNQPIVQDIDKTLIASEKMWR